NDYCSTIVKQNPKHFGFFASLMTLTDVEGVLEEIAYVFDVLGADGIILFTSYNNGQMYLGHPIFKPIWSELNRRHAVVFIHPTSASSPNGKPKLINSMLPIPAIDFPHETTRTAADLIVSKTIDSNSTCKIILSHAGGTLPYIAERIAGIAGDIKTFNSNGLTKESIMNGFKNFYYDTALSTGSSTLHGLTDFVNSSKILFGSDLPYIPVSLNENIIESLENYFLKNDNRNYLEKINFKNAINIFPRLKALFHDK
ncbi:unnamed protein product, partial [Didymodactylos carnosus]